MVLWEMTLATAYFLGLKRTYGITVMIHRRASSALVTPSSVNSFTGGPVVSLMWWSESFKACNTGRSAGNSILLWL
ncbi:hypothetical protein MUK42_19035 [Musa troglodytarum]|uniref:Uncharacterized protein n=1 Tax=Musa troglodytarum TaxID=320322 RepID=A0A9E7JF81_9LILI|nr:hypothetical protein MUK42_19035 [Musa troglodytarum]